MIELFNKVVLTPEETAAALLVAKRDKYYRLQDEEKQASKLAAIQECRRMWTPEEMFKMAHNRAIELAKQSGKVHKMDAYAKPVFELLSLYFTNDAHFEQTAGYSLKKGILLRGNIGVGKTDILKAFAYNKRLCFLPVSCNEIEARCRKKGIDYWETFTGYVPGHGGTIEYFLQPQIGWLFDDLGTEETIPDYGPRFDPVEKIISQRYMLKEKMPFSSLHISTNLSWKMMQERYGDRMVSRLKEMYNVITVEGTDRRQES